MSDRSCMQNRQSAKQRARRLIGHLAIASLTSVSLFLGQAEVKHSGGIFHIASRPAQAQFMRPQDAGRLVYERLPDFPRENQYVSQETGEVAVDNTLATRLIQYHIFVKRRPPNYRFDWKLTLADYLGAHEYLVESQYPGHNTLRKNPMESDRAIIQKLDRTQRNALIDVLVSIYTPTPTTPLVPATEPTPTPTAPPPAPTPTNPGTKPRLPQPGDAQLLLP